MHADLQLHQRAAMASLLTPVQAFGALTSVSYGPGSTRTVSDASAKVDLALDRLLMRGDTSAWVTVVTAAQESLRNSTPVLEEFVREMGIPSKAG